MLPASSGDVTKSSQRRQLWPWLSLLPFGFGSWAPVVAGVRCGVLRWTVLGLFWAGIGLGGFVLTGTSSKSGSSSATVGLLLMVLGWVGGISTSFRIRRRYKERLQEGRGPRAAWPLPTERSRRWSARYALAAYALTFAGVLAVAGLLKYVLHAHLHVGAGVLIVDAMLLAALLPLARRRGLSREDLGLRAAPGARSVGLVLLAIVVYILVAAVWVLTVIHHKSNSADILSGLKHESTLNVVLAAVAVSASAPIVEEIFFRGLLYRSLRNRLSVWPAALIAGSLFGLVHITGYPLNTLPIKAAFGVIACLLYERTGSLLPGIALHSLVDASAIDLALTGNDLIVFLAFATLAVVLLVRASTRPARTPWAQLQPDIPSPST
jgi:membrane protease YdiL (CAAX protease family)